ncbi:MAG: acetylglutamate kinase [Nitrospirae bacterium YQR-1]
MEDLIKKAEVLIEALPYIRNFYKKTFVIKYGGAAQVKDELKEAFARDIVLFNYIGINTVIVHGGGPKISSTMEKLGKSPVFVEGLRVTDRDTMDIVEMVLGGIVNKEIVTFINLHGGNAVGLTGKDGNLLRATKKIITKKCSETGVDEVVDIGLVGEVESVNPAILTALEENGFVPVIAPIGLSATGETLNINADYVASAVAGALKAEKLIILTDVPGIIDQDKNVISTIRKSDIEQLSSKGVITGGMLPKVRAGVSALESGVVKTHIIDGRIPNCLLLEIFTQEGIGTEIVL